MRRSVVLLPLLLLTGCSAWSNYLPSKAHVGRGAATTPPCRTGQLRTSLFLQRATGSAAGPIIVRNVGKASCAFPSAIDRAYQPDPRIRVVLLPKTGDDAFFDGDAPRWLVFGLRHLAPGQAANALLVWGNFCGKSSPRTLLLQLHDGVRLHVPLHQFPRCDAPGYPSQLSVSRFSKRTGD